MGQSMSSSGAAAGSGEVPASRDTRRMAEDVGLPSLQDFAESRPVQSAHGRVELSCETSEVAEVFFPWRLAASCRLFDMFPEVVPDLRTGWFLLELAGRAKCWATPEERHPIVVIGSSPQLSESSVKRLKLGEGLAHLCERVQLAV